MALCTCEPARRSRTTKTSNDTSEIARSSTTGEWPLSNESAPCSAKAASARAATNTRSATARNACRPCSLSCRTVPHRRFISRNSWDAEVRRSSSEAAFRSEPPAVAGGCCRAGKQKCGQKVLGRMASASPSATDVCCQGRVRRSEPPAVAGGCCRVRIRKCGQKVLGRMPPSATDVCCQGRVRRSEPPAVAGG